jgi:hypothetical protein
MLGPITATVTLTTPAPAQAAWAAFATAERWPEVLPDIAEARIEPNGALAPGATIKTVAQPGRNIIDMSYQVLAVDPQRRLILQSSAVGFRAHTTYDFDSMDDTDTRGGTQVTVTAAITPESVLGRISSVLWRSLFIKQVERSVQRRTAALLELAERIQATADQI